MTLAIQTTNLCREFNGMPAVTGLTLAVPEGALFGFLGPNGAGKTTTIRMLLGLMRPTSGSAFVLGHDVRTDGQAIRRSVGALLENTGVYDRLSVLKNMELTGRIWGMSPAESRNAAHGLLERFGVLHRATDPAGQLSRGMKQKLAIAKALLPSPKLLFLDEPTANLDVESAISLREALINLVSEERVTVFLTTHNLAEAERICSHVALIREGRLIQAGPPRILSGKVARRRVHLFGKGFGSDVLSGIRLMSIVTSARSTGDSLIVDIREVSAIPLVLAEVTRLGGEIDHFSEGETTLEDVYLETMHQGEPSCSETSL